MCRPFFSFPSSQPKTKRLDEAELGGSNVESIDISSQAGEGLLGAVRAVSVLAMSQADGS
jgi:hypothetical protein